MCIFIFKILNNMFPDALRNELGIAGSDSERQTRQAENIVIDFQNKKCAEGYVL